MTIRALHGKIQVNEALLERSTIIASVREILAAALSAGDWSDDLSCDIRDALDRLDKPVIEVEKTAEGSLTGEWSSTLGAFIEHTGLARLEMGKETEFKLEVHGGGYEYFHRTKPTYGSQHGRGELHPTDRCETGFPNQIEGLCMWCGRTLM
jgi:hypothetical protein